MDTFERLREEETVPVVITNQQGLITHTNKPFQRVFGWSEDEVLGKPLTLIIPKALHDAHHLGFSRFLNTGRPTLLDRPLQLKAVTKGGREFAAEHIISAEKRNGEWIFGATIRPLVEV